MSRPRLIAVCGYSEGRGDGLHDICAGRLRRAEQESKPDDVVLLTGWARRGVGASEAELMARSWRGRSRRVLLDTGARSTVDNVVAAARCAHRVNAGHVVLVTSGWHARRAAALLRAALRHTDATVVLAATSERPSRTNRLRELVCWTLVPFARLRAAEKPRSGGASR